MSGDIRNIYAGGTWYAFQGKGVEKLKGDRITELCKKTVGSGGAFIEATSGIRVSVLGGRRYTAEGGLIFSEPQYQKGKKVSFLRSLCSRFISFVTKRLLSSEESRVAEIRFAMQLYDSQDKELLTKICDDPKAEKGIRDLPFSQLLENWLSALSFAEIPSETKSAAKTAFSETKFLVQAQKKIEEIRQTKRKGGRQKESEKLIRQLTAAIYDLDREKSIYIPGGIWRSSTNEAYPMVYRITKKEEGLILNAVDMSDQLFTSATESNPCSKGDFQIKGAEMFIRETVALLSSPEASLKEEDALYQLKEKIKEKVPDLIFALDGDSIASAEMPVQTERKKSELGRSTEVFIEKLAPEVFEKNRVLLKVKSFFSIWDGAGSLIADAEFRGWLAQNAENVLAEIKNTTLGSDERKVIEKRLEDIAQQIALYDQKIRSPVHQETKQRGEFEDPLSPSFSYVSMKNLSSRSEKPASLEKLFDMSQVLENGTSEAAMKSLQCHIKDVKKLADKKEFVRAHFHVKEVFLALEVCTADQKKAIAKSEQYEQWLDAIKELSFLLPRLSFGRNRLSPSSEDMRFYLQALRFQDELARIARPDDTYVKWFTLDMAPVEMILKNPYINLGDDAHEIYSHINYFKDLKKLSFRGNDPDPSYQTDKYFSVQDGEGATGKVDIGEKTSLPKHVNNARESYCLLQAFLAPTRSFVPHAMKDYLRVVGDVVCERGGGGSLDKILELGGDIAYPKMVERVCRNLGSRFGEVRIKYVEDTIFEKSCFVIEPWGMAVVDFDDSLAFPGLGTRFDFEHPGHFDKNGVPVESKMFRERCFEQVVSRAFYDKKEAVHRPFGDDGEEKDLVSEASYKAHRMKGRTEWQILQDQSQIFALPPRTFQELQLCQTGPRSIAENTLAFIAQNTALLGDAKVGFAIARLLERNFFRNEVFEKGRQGLIFEQIKDQFSKAKITGTNLFACLHLYEIARQMYANAKDRDSLEKGFEEMSQVFAGLEEAFKEKGGLHPYLEIRLATYDMQRRQGKEVSVEKIVEDLFKYKTGGVIQEWTDPIREGAITEMVMKCLPKLAEQLQDPQDLCNTIFQIFFPDSKDMKWEKFGDSGLIFVSGEHTIDFSRFEIWEKGVRKGKLPAEVTQGASFSAFERLIHQKDSTLDVREASWTLKPVEIPSDSADVKRCDAIEYDLTVGETAFRILSGMDGTTRLYRKNKGESWFLYQNTLFSGDQKEGAFIDALPRCLEKGDCWISDNTKELRIEKDGKIQLQAELSGGDALRICKAERVSDHREIANIVQDRGMKRLFDMDDASYVTAYGKKGVDQIEYERFSYVLEKKGEKWVSKQYDGYYLSDKTLEGYASSPGTSADVSRNPSVSKQLEQLQKLFHPSFGCYHLLEHDNKPPKILMPDVALGVQKTVSGKELSYRFQPQWQKGELDKISLYEFDIDASQGLIPKEQPEGYLHLASSLCAQGNYKDAFYYLQKIDFNRPLSETGKGMFSRLESLARKVSSDIPEGSLLRARLFLAKARATGEKASTLMGGIQAKTLLDELSPLKEQGVFVPQRDLAELTNLSKASWISIFIQLSEEEENEQIIQNMRELLNVVFIDLNDLPLEDVKMKELANLTGVTQDEKENLKKLLVRLNKCSCVDDSVRFDQLAVLQSTSAWKKFDEKILKPFDIGLEELLHMEKGGMFNELSSLAEKALKAENFEKSFSKKELDLLVEATRIREQFLLKARIDRLQKSLPEGRKVKIQAEIKSVPLFEEIPGKACFQDIEKDTSSCLLVSDDLKELGDISGLSPYAKEIERDLNIDFKEYAVPAEKAGEKEKPKTVKDRAGFCTSLKQVMEEKRQKTQGKKRVILAMFKPLFEVKDLMVQFKRVGRDTADALFDTAIRCYGEDNWDDIKPFPKSGELEELQKSIHSFLKSAVQLRQLETAHLKATKLFEDQNQGEYAQTSQEIYDLLTTKWQYDVDQDPLAHTVLLIEYELGFICRGSQLAVVKDNLTQDNRFKQEICGGGKTTVLRNIISQFRADGATLSGVSTLDPLRAEHGLLYSRTTKNAFGEQVFDFRFERNSPADELSLRELHCDLLETTVHRGRIDLTKGDLQSFASVTVLKREAIVKKRKAIESLSVKKERKEVFEEIDVLHREINIMENILDFLQEHASIMADELDKDCDPTQEKNCAYGTSGALNEHKQAAAVSILRTIFASQQGSDLCKLQAALRNNKQARFPKEDCQKAIKEIATQIYEDLNGSLKEISCEDFVAYLTDPSSEGAKKVYNKLFFQDSEKRPVTDSLQKIAFFRKFLSEILPHAMTKTSGVSYGRSRRDGVSVIPYFGSDKPKEGAMHGNDFERAWYASVDYMQKGLSKDQVRSLWITAKEQATKELSTAYRQKDDNIKTIDDTLSAKEFKKAYITGKGKTFSSLRDEDIDPLCDAIQESPDLMMAFIEKNVLPQLRQAEEKVVSDAQDPPHMVKSYSGSSGTDTGQWALPDKITVTDCRQKGVHGRVVHFLIESEKSQKAGDVFLSYGEDKGPEEILFSEMKGGDCLVDVGRLFPGISPKEIAKSLMKGIPKETRIEYIVFMDSEDRWQMLSKDGSEVKYESTEDGKVLKKRITIFDDVHTRGAERDSTEGVTEFVTLDVDTDWSRFEQAVARERNLFKGKAKVKYVFSPQLQAQLPGVSSFVELREKILSKNEAEHLQQINYKAERQRVKHILKRIAGQALREISKESRAIGSSHHHQLREHLFSLERDLFIVSNEIDVFQAAEPLKEQSQSEALDGLVFQQLKILDKIAAELKKCSIKDCKPVTYEEVHGSLESVSGKVDALLEKQTELQTSLTELSKKAGQSGAPGLGKIKEQADAALKKLGDKKTTDQVEIMRQQKAKLDRFLASQEQFLALPENMQAEALDQFRATAKESRNQLIVVRKEIEEQQQAISSKTEEAPKSEGPEESKPGGIWGALTRGAGEFKKRVVETVSAVTEKAGLKYFDNRTDGGVTKVLTSMEVLHKAVCDLEGEFAKLGETGKPLVDLAIDTLYQAKAMLWAKYSEEQRKETPQEIAEEVARYVVNGKGRVDSKYLPEMVSGASDLDNEAEVETEAEEEVEVSQELSLAEEELGASDQELYRHIDLKLPITKEGLAENPFLHKLQLFSPFQQEGKSFTENCYPLDRSKTMLRPWGIEGEKIILPAESKKIERSLFIVPDTGVVQEVYGSQLDLDKCFFDVVNGKQVEGVQTFIFNYGIGKVDTGVQLEELGANQRKEVMKYIVGTMLQRGDVDFCDDLYTALTEFLTEQTLSLDILEGALKKAIAKYRQDVRYQGSSLATAFKEVREASQKK